MKTYFVFLPLLLMLSWKMDYKHQAILTQINTTNTMENSTENTQENDTTQDVNALKALAKYCQTYLKLAKQDLNKLNSEQKQTAKKLKSFLEFYVQQQKAGTFNNTVFDASKKGDNTEHSKEDIGLSSFVNACLSWRTDITDFFDQTIASHGAVKLEVARFRDYLARRKSTLPIVQALYKEWLTAIDQLKPEQDSLLGKVLFEALRNHQGKAWLLTADATKLEAHYKKYRKYYRKVDGAQADFEQTSLPRITTFESALKAALSDEDPNTPENRKEAQQDAKAAKEKMLEKWDNWLNSTLISNLEDIDTADKGKTIDIALLENTKGKWLESPSYAQAFWDDVANAIVQKVKALDGTPSYSTVVGIVVTVTKQKYNQHVTDEFIEQAIASKESDLPSGMQMWLGHAIDEGQTIRKNMEQLCRDWATSVRGLAAAAEAANKNRKFKVNRSKWLGLLEGLFAEVDPKFLNAFEKNLPQDKVLSLEQIDQAWSKGVSTIQGANFLEVFWSTTLATNSDESLEEALNQLKGQLPTLNMLSQKLLDARQQAEQAPELQELAQSDTVNTVLAIDWNPVPVLSAQMLGQLGQEVGLESLSEALSKLLYGVDVNIDNSSGVLLRVTAATRLEVKLPIKLERKDNSIIGIPQALATNMIKFVGQNESFYNLEVTGLKLNKAPEVNGNKSRQELLLSLNITSPELSVALNAALSALVAEGGAEVSIAKHPRKDSVDIVLVLEQSYDPTTKTIQLSFNDTARAVTESVLINDLEAVGEEKTIQTQK